MSDYPDNLAPGQLWTVRQGLVENAPMLLVKDAFGGFPYVYGVAKLSEYDDPRLVVVSDTPLGEPLVIYEYTPVHVGPQAFGELLGDLVDPSTAYSLSELDEGELAAVGLRHADGAKSDTAMRALSASIMDVMRHDPSRTKVALTDVEHDLSGLAMKTTAPCCYPGKSCGTTDLYLDAFRDTDSGQVRLRYARESNSDDYVVADTPAELVALLAERSSL